MITELKSVLLDDFWIMPQTPKYTESGIPYVTSKNIKNEKINFENVNYISIEDYKKISKNRPILKNDILISMIGTLGETAIVDDSYGEFYGQNMFLVRLDNSKIDYRYFINFFKSTYVKNHLARKQNKSTQSYLKANHIESLMIPVITIKEQKEIANQLDKVQDLIKLKTQQIEKLDDLIKSQFVEMFGDPIENPKNYKIVKLSDIADYWNGLTYKPTDVNKKGTIVLRSSNIQNSQLNYQDIVRVNCNIKEKQYVKDNDILMCSRNGSARLVGKVAVIKDIKEKMTFGAFMMIIRSEYYPYLFSYFQTDAFRNQIKSGATTTINQITGNMLNKIKLPLPDKDDINQFADFVKQIDKQKFEIQKSLDEMQELYESLMDKYFG